MKGQKFFAALIIIAGGITGMAWFQDKQTLQTISPQETHSLAEKDTNIVLLDVRTPEEYNNELGHVDRTILIPVQQLGQRIEELERYRDKTIIAICRSGNRSGKAAALLTEKGFQAKNMEGGMLRWNQEQLPVVRDSIGK
jgi:rhodanese-related sulfurtransferase